MCSHYATVKIQDQLINRTISPEATLSLGLDCVYKWCIIRLQAALFNGLHDGLMNMY